MTLDIYSIVEQSRRSCWTDTQVTEADLFEGVLVIMVFGSLAFTFFHLFTGA